MTTEPTEGDLIDFVADTFAHLDGWDIEARINRGLIDAEAFFTFARSLHSTYPKGDDQ